MTKEQMLTLNGKNSVNGYFSRSLVEHVNQHSVLVSNYNAPPLKVLNPARFAPFCYLVLAHYGGGVVQGDRIDFKLECGENTTTFLTGQGYTRIYKNIGQYSTRQRFHGVLRKNAAAIICLDPLILHAGCRFNQLQEWELDENATLI